MLNKRRELRLAGEWGWSPPFSCKCVLAAQMESTCVSYCFRSLLLNLLSVFFYLDSWFFIVKHLQIRREFLDQFDALYAPFKLRESLVPDTSDSAGVGGVVIRVWRGSAFPRL